jgi:hypothetical protein
MNQTLSRTNSRIAEHTDPRVNRQIERRAAASILFHAENPDYIQARLRALDAEWDIERALQTVSSTLTLAGLGLTIRRGPRWLLLPLAVQGFFLQHAIQGWCPPLAALRRAGFRTAEEIDRERCALLALLDDSGGPEEESDDDSSKPSRAVEMKPRQQATTAPSNGA